MKRLVCGSLLGAALLWLAGCRDSTGSDTLRGTYVLASVGGAGAPFVISDVESNGERSVIRVVYDSLRFTSDTSVQRSRRIERIIHLADGSQIGPLRAGDGYPGFFVRSGSSLVVQWRSAVNPSVNRTDTIEVHGAELVRREDVCLGCTPPAVQRSRFVYRRQ